MLTVWIAISLNDCQIPELPNIHMSCGYERGCWFEFHSFHSTCWICEGLACVRNMLVQVFLIPFKETRVPSCVVFMIIPLESYLTISLSACDKVRWR